MLEIVGQFGLQYQDKAQGTLGSLVTTPSLLSRVIESQGQDIEISSIRNRVQSGTGDEGWAIHTDGNLRYKGRGSSSPVDRFERGEVSTLIRSNSIGGSKPDSKALAEFIYQTYSFSHLKAQIFFLKLRKLFQSFR